MVGLGGREHGLGPLLVLALEQSYNLVGGLDELLGVLFVLGLRFLLLLKLVIICTLVKLTSSIFSFL